MSNRIDKTPSLNALSFVLRHKELWPKGFEWNYQSCGTCAMGLAHAVWKDHVGTPDASVMAQVFKMNPHMASHIFMSMGHDPLKVTPEAVADRLDELEPV